MICERLLIEYLVLKDNEDYIRIGGFRKSVASLYQQFQIQKSITQRKDILRNLLIFKTFKFQES